MKNQRGITLLSFIIILAVAGFTGLLLMRTYPPYTEYVRAFKQIKEVANGYGIEKKNIQDIRKELEPRFKTKKITSINLKKNLKLKRTPDGRYLLLKYEVTQKLIYNLETVVMFDKTIPIGPQKNTKAK